MVTESPEIKRPSGFASRMHYRGETVRSRYHGLGVVTSTGEHPRVRFLDGPECCVPSDTLTWAAPETYAAEVRNRTMIERYLTLRTCGYLPPYAASLPRPEFHLAAAMTRHMQGPPLPVTDSAPPDSAVLYFD